MPGNVYRVPKRRCGGGPSTMQATARQRTAPGPRTRGRTGYRGYNNTRLRLRRKTRRPKSIRALSKAVAWNSIKLHGSLQRNMQSLRITIGSNGNDIRQQYPALTDLTNFCSNNEQGGMPTDNIQNWFQMGANPAGTPPFIVTTKGYYQRKPFLGLNQADSLWTKANCDIPDTGKYWASGSEYRISLDVRGSVRVRIQVFSVNAKMIGYDTRFRTFALPGSMDMLNQMCNGNQLPRKYFKVYKDFEKLIDPLNNQTGSRCVVTFSFKHNKKIDQFQTNPAVGATNPQDNLNPTVVSAGNASGIHNVTGAYWFGYQNVPQSTPLWMLISTDVSGSPGEAGDNTCLVEIHRKVFWRDHVG